MLNRDQDSPCHCYTCENTARDLAILGVRLQRMEKDIYGNGQPGLLTKLSQLELKFYALLGGLALLEFLSGSGVVSLKALIK